MILVNKLWFYKLKRNLLVLNPLYTIETETKQSNHYDP